MSQTFRKYERLCHKKVIESLFDRSNPSNKSLSVYPIRVIFQENKGVKGSRVLFSVSKRSFKKAVDRNLVKRRLREIYRLNKGLLQTEPLSIVFLYLSREILDYSELEKAMQKVLQKISNFQSTSHAKD